MQHRVRITLKAMRVNLRRLEPVAGCLRCDKGCAYDNVCLGWLLGLRDHLNVADRDGYPALARVEGNCVTRMMENPPLGWVKGGCE